MRCLPLHDAWVVLQQSNEDIGPSFAKYVLENEHLYGFTDIEMAYLAGAFFGAGTETVRHLSFFLILYIDLRWQTAIAICTVLMAAAHFPEEQARVQDELDEVIGRKRGSSCFFRIAIL
jgi:hypothetical protein